MRARNTYIQSNGQDGRCALLDPSFPRSQTVPLLLLWLLLLRCLLSFRPDSTLVRQNLALPLFRKRFQVITLQDILRVRMLILRIDPESL